MFDSPKPLYEITLNVVVTRLYYLANLYNENCAGLLFAADHNKDVDCPPDVNSPCHNICINANESLNANNHTGPARSSRVGAHLLPAVHSGPNDSCMFLGTHHSHHHHHNYDDKLKALKKSYHHFVNTYIFGKKCHHHATNKELINFSYRVCGTICEDLLVAFQKRFKISDKILRLPIFDGEINQIRNFEIENASMLTMNGLDMLKYHKIVNLKIASMSNCTINELINCLSSWSVQNLESLSIHNCTFSRFKKVCLLLSLTKLKNLSSLDVSNTDFNNHGLEIIAEDLPNLRALNISSTKVTLLSPLVKCKSRLEKLSLINVSSSCHDEQILTELKALQYLDISEDRFYFGNTTVNDSLWLFFEKLSYFPHLTDLDISGRNIEVSDVFNLISTKRFNNKIWPIRFIGLIQTSFNYDDIIELSKLSDNSISITGNGNLEHIIESLKRYRNRDIFLQKSLFNLYNYTIQTDDRESDLNVRMNTNEISPFRTELVLLVVDLLRSNINSTSIVLASTACLYSLTKNYSADELHPHVLKQVVDVSIEAMDHYTTHQQLMKNILLTLCSDRILQEASFDRLKCVRLVMDSLITFRDIGLNRLGLAICSILAAKISTDETSFIGTNSGYMKRLLNFVEQHYCDQSETSEIILKLALAALWNFTDESPKTCEVFIKNNGLKLYIETLRIYDGNTSIETKILGLLNNIAEVSHLRNYLIDQHILLNLKKLMYSTQIDISYFAAGIIAQLGSDPNLEWSMVDCFDINDILVKMESVILSWQSPRFEMVAYRSFLPFVQLLSCDDFSSIQLWALWAIHHVCTKNSEKYCQMLNEENCLDLVISIFSKQLKQKYMIKCEKEREAIGNRLVNLACLPPLQQEKSSDICPLSKIVTYWNCHFVHKWDLPVGNEQQKPLLECVIKPGNYLPNYTLHSHSCDCHLQYFLSQDPFLRFPSLILKAFRSYNPLSMKMIH